MSARASARIQLSLPSPSQALVRFIERAIKDDDFFQLVMEAPGLMMKQNGINVSTKDITQKDLVNFVTAIVRVKKLMMDRSAQLSVETVFAPVRSSAGVAAYTYTNQSQNEGWNKDWQNDQSGYRVRSQTVHSSTNFSMDALSMTEYLEGPMISPVELNTIVTTMNQATVTTVSATRTVTTPGNITTPGMTAPGR
jgi:hypothetical protein